MEYPCADSVSYCRNDAGRWHGALPAGERLAELAPDSDAVSQPVGCPASYSIAEAATFGITLPLTLDTFTGCASGLPVTGGAVNVTLGGFAPNVMASGPEAPTHVAIGR